jgi:hypothetical protein
MISCIFVIGIKIKAKDKKTEPLKKVQHNKIENVAGSV